MLETQKVRKYDKFRNNGLNISTDTSENGTGPGVFFVFHCCSSSLLGINRTNISILTEKQEGLIQSYDKSPYIHKKI